LAALVASAIVSGIRSRAFLAETSHRFTRAIGSTAIRDASIPDREHGVHESMARYGKLAGKKVKRAVHEMKRGELESGRSGKKVKTRKQAIAIGLSEARRSGGKVPKKRKSSRKKK